MNIFLWISAIISIILLIFGSIAIYDRFIQKQNLILTNFPLIGRVRYIAHHLRPFIRQYFGNDNDFIPNIIIDWINKVSSGKSGYYGFDIFDSTHSLHNGNFQMVHAAAPKNEDEMDLKFPKLGEQKRQNPMEFHNYIYRSAMSLGAISFEATAAMASACAHEKTPFNTGEGGFSVHHIPNVVFSYDRKFFRYKQIPSFWKSLYIITPTNRLKNNLLDFLWSRYLPKGERDLYLFDTKHFVFYTIDWTADISHFPKPEELNDEFGHIIFQIGSGLYGLRKKTPDGSFDFDWDRFKKITSFCRAIEVKLAQWAKQSGGVLKAPKNTKVVSEIRGVSPGIDLISPNRFPFYKEGNEHAFFDFIEELSQKSQNKPVGIKIVITDESSIEPFAKELAKNTTKWPDFITIDGGDGGSWSAPISLSVLFGKTIFQALDIAQRVLINYGVRENVCLLASSKLHAPHLSAKALAHGADAIGNARSIMIAGGCIRAGLCSGEYGTCPVGLATMNKNNRKAYAQNFDAKVTQIRNYINAHKKGIVQVASICGVKSPSELASKHIAK